MAGVTILKYQMTYSGMTKKLYEEKPRIYQVALIDIRLHELQKKGCYVQKINKPNRNGTSITFTQAKTAEEYQQELQKIIEDGTKLGLEIRKVKRTEETEEENENVSE